MSSRNAVAVVLGAGLGMAAYTLHVPFLIGVLIASSGALLVRQVVA